jgi:hypothetical protein
LEDRQLLSGNNLVPDPQVYGTANWTLTGDAQYDGAAIWRLSNPGSGIATPLIAVTPGTQYTFSLYIDADVPHLMGAMNLGTYDASKSFLQNYLGSYESTMASHDWEKISILYTAQPGEYYVELKYMRLPAGQGPTDGGTLWMYDFNFTTGITVGPSPSSKRGFYGNMVRVDPLGNWYVPRNGTWQPYTVLGIYNDTSVNSLQTYSNQGFNTIVSNTFSLARLEQAQDAVSSFNPNGMMSMIDISPFIDPRGTYYDDLPLLQQDLVSLEKSPMLSQVLCFYWDNEQYDNYTAAQAVTNLVKAYDINAAGQRQHPIYMLDGQQGLNPLYDSMVDVVGDYVRTPQTASYLGDQPDIVQRAMLTTTSSGQSRPFSLGTISNEAYAGNFQALVYETLLAGGRGFTFYRDGGSNGYNGSLSSPAAMDITLRRWWPLLPGIVSQIDELQPLLATPVQTSWQLAASNPQLVTGIRTYNGQGYLFVVNPTDSAQAATFTANGLPYTPQQLNDYFSGSTVTTIQRNTFTLTLQPYQTRVYWLSGKSRSTPMVKVSDQGGSYTGSPFTAIATVAGINGVAGTRLEGVGIGLTYYAGTRASGPPLPGAPTTAGTYTVVARFGGSRDYAPAMAEINFVIYPMRPTQIITAFDGTYTGQPHTATVTVTGVDGVHHSSLEGVQPTLTYYAASGSALAGPPTAIGTYTVVARFKGTLDYLDVTTVTHFTISPAGI